MGSRWPRDRTAGLGQECARPMQKPTLAALARDVPMLEQELVQLGRGQVSTDWNSCFQGRASENLALGAGWVRVGGAGKDAARCPSSLPFPAFATR
jgi:hypothetical protein